ncbi:MAG TPA: biotin-dependent carboxyltransferase family protein [Saprospiraceae bacterium]|nr:biotin-dependent carboxyltransferase family protein [Saprospiraceae bacterium]HPN68452.1 biotin-dependent carboxyltransferase family protein [Saprospiraceae bacterium]
MVRSTTAFMQVLETGVYASVQDGGRFGYLHWGIPHSGFMDKALAALANELVGNPEDAPCIEFYKNNLSIRFSKSAFVAIAGIQVSFSINDAIFSGTQSILIPKGGVLKIISLPHHNWAYLAIFGGFNSEEILGSRSMMKGVTTLDKLYKGMTIAYTHTTQVSMDLSISLGKEKEKDINVIPGPEYTLLSKSIQIKVFKKPLMISPQSNRQAYVLQGFDQEIPDAQIKSGYTPAGTIQLTSAGKMFVLMNDGQTTGGYYRIGFIDKEDIGRLSQIPFGDKVQFKMIEDIKL